MRGGFPEAPPEPAAGVRRTTSPPAPSRGGISGAVAPAPGSGELGQGGGGLRMLSALASWTRCSAVSSCILHLDCWWIVEAGGDL